MRYINYICIDLKFRKAVLLKRKTLFFLPHKNKIKTCKIYEKLQIPIIFHLSCKHIRQTNR